MTRAAWQRRPGPTWRLRWRDAIATVWLRLKGRSEGLYSDRDWLLRRRYGDRLLLREMAELAGCSVTTIGRWLDKYGIRRLAGHELAALAWERGEQRRLTERAGARPRRRFRWPWQRSGA